VEVEAGFSKAGWGGFYQTGGKGGKKGKLSLALEPALAEKLDEGLKESRLVRLRKLFSRNRR